MRSKITTLFFEDHWCVGIFSNEQGNVVGAAPTKEQAERLAQLLNDCAIEWDTSIRHCDEDTEQDRARMGRVIETFRLQEGLTYKDVLGYDVDNIMIEWFKRSLTESPYANS